MSDNNYEEIEEREGRIAEAKDSTPEFSAEIRNTIIELLKHGSLTFSEKPNLYKTMCSYEKQISVYLRNINILLAHNEELGVAYIRNLYREDEVQGEDEDILEPNLDDDSHLISSRTLSEFDSIVILVLRKFYHERFSSGETRVFIDLDRISNLLIPYVGISNSTTRTLEKINGTLAKLQEKRLVRKESGNYGDRVEILPLMRFVINAEFMKQLLDEYHAKLLTKFTEEELQQKIGTTSEEKNVNE